MGPDLSRPGRKQPSHALKQLERLDSGQPDVQAASTLRAKKTGVVSKFITGVPQPGSIKLTYDGWVWRQTVNWTAKVREPSPDSTAVNVVLESVRIRIWSSGTGAASRLRPLQVGESRYLHRRMYRRCRETTKWMCRLSPTSLSLGSTRAHPSSRPYPATRGSKHDISAQFDRQDAFPSEGGCRGENLKNTFVSSEERRADPRLWRGSTLAQLKKGNSLRSCLTDPQHLPHGHRFETPNVTEI